MKDADHYIIIGNGVAGNEAAWYLRQRDPKSHITMVTAGKLLFLNRYRFPEIFEGVDDWREFLIHPPEYYEDNRINVRRYTIVDRVDPERKVLELRHKEALSYDKLLVASGGSGYLPEYLLEYRHMLHDFGTVRAAMQMREVMPASGGKVVMLGCDMRGLDLARSLISVGREVVIVSGEQLFWPHAVPAEKLEDFSRALEKMGMQIIRDRTVARIEEGAQGMRSRRLVFKDGSDLYADVVMAFCGLTPTLDFMVGGGVDIERGLLVNPQLRTVNENIWAAGDVCQIWSPEENHYRFYYGWKNVKMMGRLAAINMTGGDEAVDTLEGDRLYINDQGEIDSTFWETE
ncbi:MAG: FAD-dependent oxidoreductase [Gammaproteobacteria bacterium]|nr:FAD-dependent oxidoreductase [Gammaproteobacteria bacterium]